jgi:hypothetical protein
MHVHALSLMFSCSHVHYCNFRAKLQMPLEVGGENGTMSIACRVDKTLEPKHPARKEQMGTALR